MYIQLRTQTRRCLYTLKYNRIVACTCVCSSLAPGQPCPWSALPLVSLVPGQPCPWSALPLVSLYLTRRPRRLNYARQPLPRPRLRPRPHPPSRYHHLKPYSAGPSPWTPWIPLPVRTWKALEFANQGPISCWTEWCGMRPNTVGAMGGVSWSRGIKGASCMRCGVRCGGVVWCGVGCGVGCGVRCGVWGAVLRLSLSIYASLRLCRWKWVV